MKKLQCQIGGSIKGIKNVYVHVLHTENLEEK